MYEIDLEKVVARLLGSGDCHRHDCRIPWVQVRRESRPEAFWDVQLAVGTVPTVREPDQRPTLVPDRASHLYETQRATQLSVVSKAMSLSPPFETLTWIGR